MANSWDAVVGTPAYTANLERINTVAGLKGYVLNSDSERVKKVLGLMVMNKDKYGAFYCPCKLSHPFKQDDSVCPCPQIDEEVAKDGWCHCKVFYRK